MAALTVQPILAAGTTVAFSAATVTTGDTVALDTQTTVLVNNGSGSSINVTFTSKRPAADGYTVADKVVAVAAGAIKGFALDPAVYNDSTTAVATIVCSAVTTVTLAATRR